MITDENERKEIEELGRRYWLRVQELSKTDLILVEIVKKLNEYNDKLKQVEQQEVKPE